MNLRRRSMPQMPFLATVAGRALADLVALALRADELDAAGMRAMVSLAH